MVMKRISMLLFLLLFSLTLFAEKLPVKLTPQEKDQWCWAATSECAIEYYGQDITQTDIVTEVKGSPVNEPGQPDEMVQALNIGNLNAKADQNISGWTEQKIRDYLDKGYVATVGYNRQHVISLVGYTGEIGSAIYHMMDPWPVNQGEWKDYSWATFLNNEIGPLDLIVTTEGSTPDIDTITVTSPKSGDEWMQGSDQTITWEDNIDGQVSITLVKGSSKTVVTTGTASTGSFSWTVPEDQVAGSGYTVVITSVDNSSVSDESGSFTISEVDLTEYTLTVTGGDGSGDYVKGTKVTITADAPPADSLMFDAWTGNGAAYCADKKSSSTTLTMPDNACEVTATYKEKPPTSDNLVLINDWEEQVDKASSLSIDSSKVQSDTLVTFNFTLGTQASDTDYVWTQVYHYLDTAKGAFNNVSAIELIYKSEVDLDIILSQEGLSDAGANYRHTLDASSSFKTLIVPISMDNFSQPSWVEGDLKKDLDIGKCNGIGFSPVLKEGESAKVEFTLVCLVGYVPPVSLVQATASTQKGVVLQALQANKMVLSIPQRDLYTVSIFSVDGKMLLKKSVELSKGMQTLAIGSSAYGKKVLLVKVENSSGKQLLQKCYMK